MHPFDMQEEIASFPAIRYQADRTRGQQSDPVLRPLVDELPPPMELEERDLMLICRFRTV